MQTFASVRFVQRKFPVFKVKLDTNVGERKFPVFKVKLGTNIVVSSSFVQYLVSIIIVQRESIAELWAL